jgi:hypothetical protein
VLGRWSIGIFGKHLAASVNETIWNRDHRFESEKLPGPAGETLATLISDIDVDGDLDVIFGNDFGISDSFYLGDGTGALRLIRRDDDFIPHTTRSTMSIDSADIDNDLRFELYLGQTTGRSGTRSQEMALVSTDEVCEEYARYGLRERCEERANTISVINRARKTLDPTVCLELRDEVARGDCIALHRLRWATTKRKNADLCAGFPAWWEPFEHICHTRFGPSMKSTKKERRTHIRQTKGRNVLFVPRDGVGFDDVAEERGTSTTGWTWNAKFADFDSDGWQDLYAVNGMLWSSKRESNVFFANRGDGHFDDLTQSAGLASAMAAVSAAYVDFDQDGDRDIVTVPIDGPILVNRNNSHGNNGLVVELADQRGNHFGIGSRIVVHYGPEASLHQMREIKASGGFTSFDPPEAHFGLGSHEGVDRIEVHWSTGAASELSGPFRANHRYRISRRDVARPPPR